MRCRIFKPYAPNSVFYLIAPLFFFALMFLSGCSNTSSSPKETNKNLSLEDRVKEAQIINQEAQANYYIKQSENSGSFWIAYSAHITTVVGILIALLTLTIQGRNARRLESEKWEQARKDDLTKWERVRDDEKERRKQAQKDENAREARLAAAELLRKIAAAAQSITWIARIALNHTEDFSTELVKEHDELMRGLHTEIVATQIILASYDKPLYLKTQKMVGLILYYDARFADLVKDIDDEEKTNDLDNYKQKVARIGELWREIFDFGRSLPIIFANMVNIPADREK